MKKFTQPFDAYLLGPERPMAIEQHPQGLARYKYLFDNPIYYQNAFQYTGGSIYRATLGYEQVWDKEFEDELVLLLDYFLNHLIKRREYFIEEIEFNYKLRIMGEYWHRNIAPKHLNFFSARQPKAVKAGARATARVNLIDKPNHVDIEFDDGEIFTVSYLNYLYWKKKHIRSLDHAPEQQQPEPASPSKENAKRREVESAAGPRFEITHWNLPNNVLDMRQRFRRSDSLQKTHKKVR